MYKLIIVDDEQMMRDGLSNLIKWEDMGFEVAAVLEDGKDAIEWLSDNHADVVLTDLKMTFNSGIDIAKFIKEKNLAIKIIIISGHSDFEAAREAIVHKVSHYLLKPISVKNIRTTFNSLYDELNELDILQKSREEDIQRYKKIYSYLENEFITNLVLGALRQNSQLVKQLKLINWDISALNNSCILFELSLITNINRLNIEHESQEIHLMIAGIVSRLIDPAKLFWIRTTQESLVGIILYDANIDNTHKIDAKNVLNQVINTMKVIGIAPKIIRIENYDSLLTLSKISSNVKSKILDEDILRQLRERQQLIMSHITHIKKSMAIELLESYIDIISDLNINTIKNIIVDLFANLNNNILRYDTQKNNYNQFPYCEILALENVNAIRKWCVDKLENMISKIENNTSDNYNIIARAKEYIKENYNKDISLNDVAEHVFLSPVYLSRLFKVQTGTNFSEFLVECRLIKACDLLRNSQTKVYEICNEVGYSNVKYFYNLFRKKIGCTPSEYRHQ